MVILDILRLDGSECSETDMEGDESDADTLFAQGVKEFGSKMQPCCRCGGAAALTGIDSLMLYNAAEASRLSYRVAQRIRRHM